MWKPHQSSVPDAVIPPNPVPLSQPARSSEPAVRPAPAPASIAAQSVLKAGLAVKGEIRGSDSLYVDGLVEGSIHLTGGRITVGPNGRVIAGAASGKSACIQAGEVVVQGSVQGHIHAADRVEIRANGNVAGDISTLRVSIEDGAIFRGGIDIRKTDSETASNPAEAHHYAGAST